MNKKKLRYSILKEIDNGNSNLNENNFGISEEEFFNAINFLVREDYLGGVYYADDRPWLDEIGPFLTEKGENYLEENSPLAKTYKGLKEVREWIK